MKTEPRARLLSPQKRRFAELRAKLARIDVCQSCGRSFEPVEEPGKVACPHCGSYLRWSDTLTAHRDLSRVRCLIPPPMYGPVQRDPALMAQLRNLFRSQQRHRRKDKDE